MKVVYNEHQELEEVTLFPGEYHATRERKIINTLLGSCVAVVLFDLENGVVGMNHFMLPRAISWNQPFLSEGGRYGMYAMELLINDAMKLGGVRDRFKAKVFGGGGVLDMGDRTDSSIPEDNIGFAFEYLKIEGIPVVSHDVGGREARRIYLFTEDATVRLRRIERSAS